MTHATLELGSTLDRFAVATFDGANGLSMVDFQFFYLTHAAAHTLSLFPVVVVS